MKNKLRKLLLAFSFGLLFASTACELQEDVIEKHNHEHKTLVISKSFSELSLDPKFMKSYKRIPTKQAILNSISKKSVAARTEIEEEYGFTIFDAPIRVYESDTLITYNLLIESDVVEKGNYFENLIINTNPSKDITDIYKIKFFYDEGVEIVEDYLVKNPIKIILTPIYYNNHPFNEADKSSMTCIRISGLLCYDRGSNNQYSIPHEIGSDCSESQAYYGYGTVDVVCTTASGSGGGFDYSGDGGGPQDPHQGGSNGNGNHHQVYSNPTPPCDPRIECPPIDVYEDGKSPCDELNKISNDSVVKSKLDDLDTKTGLPSENGWAVPKDGTGFGTPVFIQASTQNPNMINIAPYIDGNYVLIFHTHPKPINGYYPMFADKDFDAFKDLIFFSTLRPRPITEFTLALTVEDGSGTKHTYAIKVKNLNEFITCMNKKIDVLKSDIERDYNNRSTTDPISGFEQDLLKKFYKFNSGLGLYKSNADHTAWNEVVLNDSGFPEQFPCNN